MFNPQKTIIREFVKELKDSYVESFGLMQPEYGNIVAWAGQLALENISNSDALYHDVEHTIMVTLAGQEILKGKHLSEGNVSPRDWLNVMIALLCHDIGYVRGICRSDRGHTLASGIGNNMINLSFTGTDASLAPYHIDRSKLFIRERFNGHSHIDAEAISGYIEMTRFPVPNEEVYRETKTYGALVRAADLIGQLGDPSRMRKIPALYYEFFENGYTQSLGYKHPEDMRRDFVQFYWDHISEYLNDAIRFLRVTQEGKEWIANLHAQVFASEHR